uniref:Dynactin subunit 1 n=1 Tax=Lepeophtheirus salmonis TaxID=72036 RepID=D3PI30_LEPSM|nr:Dynactin subunit 1 [Lepeophtheirus salmonis]
MDSKATVRVGQRVCLKDKKDVEGVVSFFGFPDFAPGKWVGLTLDTPKGKNNGTVQGRSYFTCPENYGMFVRQTNIMILGPSENTSPSSMSSSVTLKSRLPVLGATKSGSVGSRSPSFTDLKGKKTPKPSVVNTSRIEREPSFIGMKLTSKTILMVYTIEEFNYALISMLVNTILMTTIPWQ